MQEKDLQSGLTKIDLYEELSSALDFQFQESKGKTDILEWVRGINLTGGIFTWEGNEWQREILMSDYPRICMKKAAQIGATAVFILKVLYNLVHGYYGQGAMCVMPTMDSVISYSKSRFAPLIEDNEKIRKLVSSTDSATLKKVSKSFLHFVGGQLTSSLDKGLKKSSTALKSTPVDAILVDEVDEISSKAIDLAKERLSHSKVKHEFYLSTPSLPNFGISKLYDESDGRLWMIKCQACGHETCLETEFPNSLLERQDGSVYRACVHCKKEIYSCDGHWVPQSPSQSEIHGYWISQLNSPFVEPKTILKAYNERENLQEFMNSKLGMGYIASENKIEIGDIYQCAGLEPMLTKHSGPTCAGIDIGKMIHATIAIRVKEKVLRVIYLARVSSLSDVSDICRRFNTKSVVCDVEPETRAVRQWQESEKFGIFLADYVSSALGGPQWNEEAKTLRINRTECLDSVHESIKTPGRIIFPKRCSEMDEFAKELTSSARVIEEDELGGRRLVWKKLGPDHYFHSLAYCLLASKRIKVYVEDSPLQHHIKALQLMEQARQDQAYDPLTFGLNTSEAPARERDGSDYNPMSYGLDVKDW